MMYIKIALKSDKGAINRHLLNEVIADALTEAGYEIETVGPITDEKGNKMSTDLYIVSENFTNVLREIAVEKGISTEILEAFLENEEKLGTLYHKWYECVEMDEKANDLGKDFLYELLLEFMKIPA